MAAQRVQPSSRFGVVKVLRLLHEVFLKISIIELKASLASPKQFTAEQVSLDLNSLLITHVNELKDRVFNEISINQLAFSIFPDLSEYASPQLANFFIKDLFFIEFESCVGQIRAWVLCSIFEVISVQVIEHLDNR